MSAQNRTLVFLDNGEFFMNTRNIVNVSWPNVSDAFSKPVAIFTSSFLGYDWTQPYPGKSIDGHNVHLSIASETFIDETVVKNSTTVLSSLTFGIPDHMKSNGKALPMDPSWYICRHIFISTDAATKESADKDKCPLSQACANDLASALTWGWGFTSDDSMCSQRISDPIPESCVGSFGFSRQDVLFANSTTIADPLLGPLQTSTKQQQYSWRIGTGYHHPRDALAFEIAANRSYLVATVWGFSRGADRRSAKTPTVTWTCFSGGSPWVPPAHEFPDPPPHLHDNYTSTGSPSSATSSATTTSSTTTSSGPASSTTTSGGSVSTRLNVQIVYIFTTMLIAGFILGDYA